MRVSCSQSTIKECSSYTKSKFKLYQNTFGPGLGKGIYFSECYPMCEIKEYNKMEQKHSLDPDWRLCYVV